LAKASAAEAELKNILSQLNKQVQLISTSAQSAPNDKQLQDIKSKYETAEIDAKQKAEIIANQKQTLEQLIFDNQNITEDSNRRNEELKRLQSVINNQAKQFVNIEQIAKSINSTLASKYAQFDQQQRELEKLQMIYRTHEEQNTKYKEELEKTKIGARSWRIYFKNN
jgi:chromosome segregation ATPase